MSTFPSGPKYGAVRPLIWLAVLLLIVAWITGVLTQ